MKNRILLLMMVLVSTLANAQVTRNYLRAKGNDYPLPQQAAKAVVNWRIFPRFNLTNHDVLYWGPRFRKVSGDAGEWDDDWARHGFSQVAPQFFDTSSGNAEDSRDRNLDGSQMFAVFPMPGGPGNMPDLFKSKFNELPENDRRKPFIRDYMQRMVPVGDTAAARLMGRWIGQLLKYDICAGKNPKYISIDEESADYSAVPTGQSSSPGEPVMRTFLGAMYQGALEICQGSKIFTYGQKVTPMTIGYNGYADQGRVIDGKLWYENPRFLSNAYWAGNNLVSNPVDNTSEMAQALRANGGGVAAGDHYWKNTIGQGTIYQKNADGTYKLSNGRRMLRNDNGTTTLYGKTFTIYGNDVNFYNQNEYEWWTNWLYEDVTFDDAHRFWLNGGSYPLRKNDRTSAFIGVKTGDWYRTHTEEAHAPGQLDSRPLNPEGLETGMLFRLLQHDADMIWHGEYLQRGPISHENGQDYQGQQGRSAGYKTNLGQYEVITKAMHRFSEFEYLPWGNHYWIRPHRGIDANPDKWAEPVIRGRISETGNYVQLVAEWPILDPEDQVRVNVWFDTGNWKSKTTYFTLKGRAPFIDAFQPSDVPAGVQLLPQHMRVRFTNIYGQTYTWAGDYRFTASNDEVMPDLVVPTAVTPPNACLGTLAVATVPTSPSCNQAYTVSVTCSGTACAGTTYTWNGPGVNSVVGATASATQATAGTYTYTVTAAKPGCPSKQLTLPVTVSGCTPTTDLIAYNRTLEAEGPDATGSGPLYGDIKAGEITYTLSDVPGPGSYTVAITYQSTGNAPTALVSLNGGTVVSVPLVATDGGRATTSATISGFVTGVNVLRIGQDGYFATDNIVVRRSGKATDPDSESATCSFTLAANTVYTSCGGVASLVATAAGSGTSGLQYSWTGPNNFTGSGASIAVAAAQADGTYVYTVTAARSGCSKTATARVIVSGCVSEPGSGVFSFQVPTNPTNWDGYDGRSLGNVPPHGPILVGNYFKQENERFILYVNEGHGGLVTIYDKLLNRWLTNRPDQGRGDGYSSYSGPESYDDDAPHWHTKYNPLKNGDSGGHGTPITFKSKITINGIEYLYTRSDYMLSWSHVDSRRIPMTYEQWTALTLKNGTDIVDSHTRLTHARANDLTDYGPFLQEWSLMMINGRRQVYFYNGDKPYTNDDVKATDGFEKIVYNKAGNPIWITPGKPHPVSEPWIGVDIGGNRMIAHYSKTLYYPSFNLMDGPEGGDCDGCKTGEYTSGHMMAHLDPFMQRTFDDTWILGTLAQVRAFVYAQPKASKPHYIFDQSTGRAGWVAFDHTSGPQEPFTTNNGWTTSFDGKTDNNVTSADNCKLRSPYTSFKAGDCSTLYVKAALSGTTNKNWKVNYTYTGQEVDGFESVNVDDVPIYAPNQQAIRFPKGVRPPDQAQAFTMEPDGVERVYTIPMNWTSTNYIHQMEIQQNATRTAGGAKLRLTYVGCTKPN